MMRSRGIMRDIVAEIFVVPLLLMLLMMTTTTLDTTADTTVVDPLATTRKGI